VKAVIVDLHAEKRKLEDSRFELLHVEPMPNVWQGKHRITSADCWAAATARNTGLCLTTTEWVAFVDDRSVLSFKWLEAVRHAMAGRYVVAGGYRKVHDLVVEDGLLVSSTEIPDGSDHRLRTYPSDRAVPCTGSNVFGASLALPIEWMLDVNGFDETTNGLGVEDCMFGCMLQNRRLPIRYDYSMLVIEDRTPGHLDPAPKRKDKGTSPHDKSHALVNKLSKLKRASHPRDLRKIRDAAIRGEPWPVPTGPDRDWYDGTLLRDEVWP
jgi:hypothetical protein